MPVDPIFAPQGGSNDIFAWAAESLTAPGVAVAPTSYLEVDSSQLKGNFKTKRSREKLSAGSIFNMRRSTQKAPEVGFTLRVPLSDVVVWPLLYQCGWQDTLTGAAAPYTHTGVITRPKPTSLYLQRAGKCEVYAGEYAKSLKFSMKSEQTPYVDIEFIGLKAPADVATLVPTYIADYTYGPTDFQAVRLLTLAAATSLDVDNVEIDVTFTDDPFVGMGGGGFPTYLTTVEADVKGKFTKVFTSRDEYNAYKNATQAPGTLAFSIGTGARSVAFNLSGVTYPDHDFAADGAKTKVEDFTFECDCETTLNPLGLVVVNTASTAYTAA